MTTIIPRALSFSLFSACPQHKEASAEERDATAGKNYSEFRNGGLKFELQLEESVLELERLRMSRVLRNGKVKAISTLASGQDLLALLKPTPPTPLFMPKCFLFQTVFFSSE